MATLSCSAPKNFISAGVEAPYSYSDGNATKPVGARSGGGNESGNDNTRSSGRSNRRDDRDGRGGDNGDNNDPKQSVAKQSRISVDAIAELAYNRINIRGELMICSRLVSAFLQCHS